MSESNTAESTEQNASKQSHPPTKNVMLIRWRRAAAMMVTTPHLHKVATDCGVAIWTLQRWLKNPEFIKVYLEYSREACPLIAAEAQAACSGLFSRMQAIAVEARRNGDLKVALEAEKSIADCHLKFAEFEAVAHRMAALEEMFRQQQQKPAVGQSPSMPLLQRLEGMEVKAEGANPCGP